MFQNKVALVTGAGKGLGAYLARRLAETEYAVAIHYRNSKNEAELLSSDLQRMGLNVLTVQGDLENASDARTVIQTILDRWNRLDVLINNSGTYEPFPLSELTPSAWQTGLNSTVTAAFHLTQAALPALRHPGGRIIMIGDSSCDRLTARDLALSYHIGKTGVLMLTKSLAQAEAAHGITVNCISPGYLENSLNLPPSESIPSKKFGTFEDIWQATEFLLRSEAHYINGTNLIISGGWNLR